MGTKIPVKSLYDSCEMMLRDHWGYIYGTAGVEWTASKQKALEDKYSPDDPNYGMSVRYGKKWINHMVSDCSGVMVYIWRQYGLKIPHGSSSMVRQKYIVDCGPTPHPGWAALVDPTPDTDDNKHIGIVGPDGVTVYEAKGAQAGFVTSKVTDSKWKKFGRFKDVDYSGEVEPLPDMGIQVDYQAEVTTKSGSLNLRSGPGTKYPIVDQIPKGARVTVWMEYQDGWRFVDYNGEQGYVSGQYLTPLPTATSVPDEPLPPPSEAPSPEGKATRLRRSDGVEIILDGDWKIIGVE